MSSVIRDNGEESAVHGVFTQIRKMRRNDWLPLLYLILAFVPGKIWKMFSRDIWVITEYEELARDNGYWLFKYIRENFREKKVYYPIKKDCFDYNKIHNLGNDIQFGSFKHYCLFWSANKYIGTTKCYGFPYRRICEDLVQWKLHGFKYVFLNHGFTRGYSSIVDANETRYDLLVTCSKLDREIIIKENYQRENVVKLLGYPRHDALNNELLDDKQVLIMPTWRNWLDIRGKKGNEKKRILGKFFKSKYYTAYKSLLNNKLLLDYAEANDLKIVFYLHEYAQEYTRYFKSQDSSVVIASNKNYDVQKLLKSSKLLITDYSSVCYDFAYMYKPMIYYQFDVEEFEKSQYSEGRYYSYIENGFGPIVHNEKDLLKYVFDILDEGRISPFYKERVEDFFCYRDKDNCKRVYKAICEL